jgi:hypothetical protein
MDRVQEIGTEREFRGLRHIRDDVLARSGLGNMFSAWDWAVREGVFAEVILCVSTGSISSSPY